MLTNGVISTVLGVACTLALAAGSTAVVKTYTNATRIQTLEKSDVSTLRVNVAVAEEQITSIQKDVTTIEEDVKQIKDSQKKIEEDVKDIKRDGKSVNDKLEKILRKLP